MRSAARKSGKPSCAVGGDHADQRDALEVVPLGDHLRADQNIDAAGGERAQNLLEGALAARGVAIEARDARIGKQRAQRLLELLGARADEIDVLGGAFRAGARHAA